MQEEKESSKEKVDFPPSPEYRELAWMAQLGDDDMVLADDYKPIWLAGDDEALPKLS